ncbi:hypothetical protein KIN20_025435, partial [Parelaphostrongylus tenuis]
MMMTTCIISGNTVTTTCLAMGVPGAPAVGAGVNMCRLDMPKDFTPIPFQHLSISETYDGDESSTGDDVGPSTAMKNRSYYHLKPSSREIIGGVRAIELVGSKCYRTIDGFQKEATFPCRPLVAHTYSSSSSEGSTNSGKRGPLERFSLMIGENILHFRIVKAPVEQRCLD